MAIIDVADWESRGGRRKAGESGFEENDWEVMPGAAAATPSPFAASTPSVPGPNVESVPDYSSSWTMPNFPTGKPSQEGLSRAYELILGRPIDPSGWPSYNYDPRYLENIFRSPEAQGYRQRTQVPSWWEGYNWLTMTPPRQGQAAAPATPEPPKGGGPSGGDYRSWFMSLVNDKAPTPASLVGLEGVLNQYGVKVLRNSEGTAGKIQLPDGRIVDVIIAAGRGGEGWWWDEVGGGSSQQPRSFTDMVQGFESSQYQPQYQAPAQYGRSQQVFDDPATREWEQLLRSLVDRLEAPQPASDLGPLQDYLRQYFEQLQGPAYTPAQMELMQTQTLDPLEAQRGAQKQQVVQRFASKGIPPSSGIVQSALADVDRGFDRLRTQTQGQFATQAVSRDRENKQMAAQVGASLEQLERARTAADEQRALQGLSLMFQIPQLADSRMASAQNVLSGTQVSPAQLLSLVPGYQNAALQQQQQGYNQQLALMQSIGQILAGLFS